MSEQLEAHTLGDGGTGTEPGSAPAPRLIGRLSARSRYILAAMDRAGDCTVTPTWLAERLFSPTIDRQEEKVQRYVRRAMRQLRNELEGIDPVPGRETLIRDRTGYRLNRDNPVVTAVIEEVQATL